MSSQKSYDDNGIAESRKFEDDNLRASVLVLGNAIDTIENAWCQGQFIDERVIVEPGLNTTRCYYCAVGAIAMASLCLPSDFDQELVKELACHAILREIIEARRISGYETQDSGWIASQAVIEFNDAKSTTKDKMISTMRRAYRRLMWGMSDPDPLMLTYEPAR